MSNGYGEWFLGLGSSADDPTVVDMWDVDEGEAQRDAAIDPYQWGQTGQRVYAWNGEELSQADALSEGMYGSEAEVGALSAGARKGAEFGIGALVGAALAFFLKR